MRSRMTTKQTKQSRTATETENLLDRIYEATESDLLDPKAEKAARDLLRSLRRRGFRLMSLDRDDPNCLACLHLSLMHSMDVVERSLGISHSASAKLH